MYSRMSINVLSTIMNYILFVFTASWNALCVLSLPFGFSDWFKIDEGSLQIDDGEIPCWPTGYKCDYNEECCDGMCVLSKLSRHKLCLVVGWKDELKLRDIYSHNPLRPQDVEYLRRTYNISEDVSTRSPKRQIHVVYDEDIYDIPSLPDENKLFPITDDPFMYDMITTTQATTSTARIRSYASTTRAFMVKNSHTFPYQNCTDNKTYTNILLNPNITGFTKSIFENREENALPPIKSREDVDKYGFLSTETDKMLSRGTSINRENGLEVATNQTDFVEREHKYNRKSNSGKSQNIPPETANNRSSDSVSRLIPQIQKANFLGKNTTAIKGQKMNIKNFAEITLNPKILSSYFKSNNSTVTASAEVSSFLDDGTIARNNTLTNNSINFTNATPSMLTVSEIQTQFDAYSPPDNVTPGEIAEDYSTAAILKLLTPSTEIYGNYIHYKDLQDEKTTLATRSASNRSSSDNYESTGTSEVYYIATPSILLLSQNAVLVTTEVENVIDNRFQLNECIKYPDNLGDYGLVNSTVGATKQENIEITPDYATEFTSKILSDTAVLPIPHTKNFTENFTELNGSVSLQDNTDSDVDNIALTNIGHSSNKTNFNYSKEFGIQFLTETSTALTYNSRFVNKNFTSTRKSINFRDSGDPNALKKTTDRSIDYQTTEIIGDYSRPFSDIHSKGIGSTVQYAAVTDGVKYKRGIFRMIKHGMGKVLHHKKRKHTKVTTTEDYSNDSEGDENKYLKFNIFQQNQTTRKKSKTKKLWKGFKQLFHRKHNKTDTETASESRLKELEDSIEEKSQSDFIKVEHKNIVDDVEKRYETSFVLPLNKTKSRNFLSKMKGWIQSTRKEQKINIPSTPKMETKESINFLQRARKKFSKVIRKRNKLNQVPGTVTNRHFYNETITLFPITSKTVEINTQPDTTHKNKRNFKLWTRIKTLFTRANEGNTNVSSNEQNHNIPAVINDFSIRDLHKDINKSIKREDILTN